MTLWDVATAQRIGRTIDNVDQISAVAISHDGSKAVVVYKKLFMRIWDLHRGEVLKTEIGQLGSIRCLLFTPDQKHIVTAGQEDFCGFGTLRPVNWNSDTRDTQRRCGPLRLARTVKNSLPPAWI